MSASRYRTKFGEDLSVARDQVDRLHREAAQASRTNSQGWPSRRGTLRRQAYKGAIIASEDRNGVTYELHATKGWRRVGRIGWPR